MFFLRVFLCCFFYLLMAKAQCFSDQEKYCLEENIDEIVLQLMKNSYNEYPVLDLIDQQYIEKAELNGTEFFYIFGGASVIYIACSLALGIWWYCRNGERDVPIGRAVTRTGLPV